MRKEANDATEVLKKIQDRNLKLEEELKVKTLIIEADKVLRKELQHHNQTEWFSDEVNRHNIPQYKCDICEWKTHNKKYLTGHMTSHKTQEEFPRILKCNLCDLKSKNIASFKGHEKAHKEMICCGE